MKEKRPVYNGYTEEYLTGSALKQRFADTYYLAHHFESAMALTIPTYLTLVGVEDEKTYRVFLKDGLCKVMRSDTDGEVAYFGYDTLEDLERKGLEPALDDHNTICPECGSELKFRQSRYGVFIGCASYPKCGYKENTRYLERAHSEDAL